MEQKKLYVQKKTRRIVIAKFVNAFFFFISAGVLL